MEGEGVKQNLVFPTPVESLASWIVCYTLRVENKQIIFMFITVVIVVVLMKHEYTALRKPNSRQVHFLCDFQIHVNIMGITGVRVLKGFHSI